MSEDDGDVGNDNGDAGVATEAPPSAEEIDTLQHQLEYFRTMRQRAEAMVQQLQPTARAPPPPAAADADAPRRGPGSSDPDELREQLMLLQRKKRQLDALAEQMAALRAAQLAGSDDTESDPAKPAQNQDGQSRSSAAPPAREMAAAGTAKRAPAPSAPTTASDAEIQAELSDLQQKRKAVDEMRAKLSALREAQASAEQERKELESLQQREAEADAAESGRANGEYDEYDEDEAQGSDDDVGNPGSGGDDDDDDDDNGDDDGDDDDDTVSGGNRDRDEYNEDDIAAEFGGPAAAELMEKFKLLEQMQGKLARLKEHQKELQAQADAARALGDEVRGAVSVCRRYVCARIMRVLETVHGLKTFVVVYMAQKYGGPIHTHTHTHTHTH